MDFDEDDAGNTAGPDNALNHGSDIVEDREDSEHEMQGGTLPADHKSEGAVGGQDHTPSSNSGDEELQGDAATIDRAQDEEKAPMSSGASASTNVETQFPWLEPSTISTIPEEEGTIGSNLGSAVSDSEESNANSLAVRLQQVAECRAVAGQEREGLEQLDRRIERLAQEIQTERNREKIESIERAMPAELGEVNSQEQLQCPIFRAVS